MNFQFQTDGTLVDFSSIQLQYTDGSDTLVSLAPTESLREYRASGSPFGGLTNRNALQWNLTDLNITSCQIVFNALGSSNSFQQAMLDTTTTCGAIVPTSRAWSAVGMPDEFNPSSNYTWRIATTSGGITGFDPAGFTVDRSGFSNSATGIFSVSQVGNDLYLNYAPIPEPSTWFPTGVGMIAVMLAGRYRHRGAGPLLGPPSEKLLGLYLSTQNRNSAKAGFQ